MAVFAFENRQHHDAVTSAVESSKGIRLSGYIIDPIPTFDMGAWLTAHQNMHNQVNGVLRLTGNDLTTVDFGDTSQLNDWIQLHASEHLAWGQALGV